MKDEVELREGLDGLDRLLEHRVRLAVMVLLSRHDRLSFTRLRDLTGETDGSIATHLRRLEEAGYVEVTKTFRDRKPLTRYALGADGRRALEAHLRALQALIREADVPGAPQSEGEDRENGER